MEGCGITTCDNGGAQVTRTSSLGYGPVAKAVQMIAADVAKLPLNVYQRVGQDRDKVANHPAHKLINLISGTPNSHTTPFDLWFDFMVDALIYGKGLLWIDRLGTTPVGLYRLHPNAWRPVEYNGQRYWANYAQRPIVWNEADVICVRGFRLDGLNPADPINLYRESLSMGINVQKFACQFFGNGAHVGGILAVPEGASTKAIDNVEKQVEAKARVTNWFKTLVLRDGFKWQSTTVDLQAGQVAEMDEQSARHVARIYNLPPSKLGLSDTVSYNSLEQENQQYLDSTLTPWLRRIQGQCNSKLLTTTERGDRFIEHLIDALAWADATTRSTIAQQGVGRWLTTDEVRRWYNLGPVDQKALEASRSATAQPAADPAGTSPATEPTPVPSPTPEPNGAPAPGSGTGSADAGITTSLTLNGAQITAAVEVLEKLQLKTLAAPAAEELLVAVGLPRESAKMMVQSQQIQAVPPTDPSAGNP